MYLPRNRNMQATLLITFNCILIFSCVFTIFSCVCLKWLTGTLLRVYLLYRTSSISISYGVSSYSTESDTVVAWTFFSFTPWRSSFIICIQRRAWPSGNKNSVNTKKNMTENYYLYRISIFYYWQYTAIWIAVYCQ